jgi:hypothetical protein
MSGITKATFVGHSSRQSLPFEKPFPNTVQSVLFTELMVARLSTLSSLNTCPLDSNPIGLARIFGGRRGCHPSPSTPRLDDNILLPNQFPYPTAQGWKNPTKYVCSFIMTSFGSDLLHEHLDTVTSIWKFHAESRIGSFCPWRRSASVAWFCLSFRRWRISTSMSLDIRNQIGKRALATILTPYGWNFYAHSRRKNLYLSEDFAPRTPALKELVGGRSTEVMPTLHNLSLEGVQPSGVRDSDLSKKALGSSSLRVSFPDSQ